MDEKEDDEINIDGNQDNDVDIETKNRNPEKGSPYYFFSKMV